MKLVSFKKAVLVNGSGVDMDKFNDKSLPEDPIFLCMSRLIKSKGLIEYARAAKITKEKYPQSRFLLAGFPDQHHDSISENEIINDWQSKYGIEYIGYAKYPEETLKKCSIYVLLSYNEGTPRSVLEAMSWEDQLLPLIHQDADKLLRMVTMVFLLRLKMFTQLRMQ